MTKMTQEELKAIEVEGARRMQNAIITLLAISGHADIAPKLLALDPAEVCKGESIRDTFTVELRTGR